jgi:transcription initiation factor TFIIH subunit 4
MSSLFEYIAGKPEEVIEKMYEDVWVCRAIFQSLTPLAKVYFQRLAFLDQSEGFHPSELEYFIKSDAADAHRIALYEMSSLRVIVLAEENSEKPLIVNRSFLSGYKSAICKIPVPWNCSAEQTKKSSGSGSNYGRNGKSGKSATTPMNRLELNAIAAVKWDDVLRYLITTDKGSPIDASIKDLISKLGFVQSGVDEYGQRRLLITAHGYEFLLRDHQSQVWVFVKETLEAYPNTCEVVSFLCTLSYCSVGFGYPLEALSALQLQLVTLYEHIGLIYASKAHFYPTAAAINMIFKKFSGQEVQHPAGETLNGAPLDGKDAVSNIGKDASSQLLIIVETTFQVTAYLTSQLHLEMLKLFVAVDIRFANMTIGRVTRGKVKRALSMGITAQHILDFLVVHAHPLVRDREHAVPSNVSDQLLVWQQENERLTHVDGTVLLDFSREPMAIGDSNTNTKSSDSQASQAFEALLKYAVSKNILLWGNRESLSLVTNVENKSELIECFYSYNKM